MERGKLAELLASHRSGVHRGHPLLEEADATRFMALFADAVSGDGNVFLANPAWRPQQRAEADRMAERGPCGDTGWLMIPSGGAGGILKFARHDSRTLGAAVRGFCAHFGMERVNAVNVLPLYHVSGLMAWMRSVVTGGSFVAWAWKDAEAGRYPADIPADCCLSLVPTQLQRLLGLKTAVAWLRKFRVIFVGGGPAWDGLLEAAARLELPLSTSYGATETAAMVAALKPEQFLRGERGCGSPMPHARIEILDGIVRVSGESIFRGYFPQSDATRSWTTGDLGTFDSGSLVILGRQDDLIMTGGKKVSAAEVEAALLASGEFSDVAVIGLPHPEWGQAVVACYPEGPTAPESRRIRQALAGLESFKHPKRYAAVGPWPRNAQGKIDRPELARLASRA